ncbi:hypothetical protein DAPPUDRAFT_261828 [Daphnia pulex]|uniref:CCHC-type domain-containing protein n=1 Tax=Daphnia pulex TaxID=6669 RepID=E9HLR6_DAPPU|nr:hypothetical protein DAPPUDRAFT_261828 [Daphnia pulex]|eukprot:EFX67280.1 hypothetical protein DAPPUDRAFT_261828 [Daphnia pulex]
MQIPLPVPFPLARGSLARERSPLLELLGGLLVKSPSEVSRSPGRCRPFRRSSVLMRKFPMPCLLWHACELVNYRLKPTTQFLCCLLLCLSAAATMPGSAGRMDSVSLHSRTVDSCDTAGCQECLAATTPTTRPYFRSALTRSVYSKILVDEEFKTFDRTKKPLTMLLALMLVGRMTADGAGGASHQAADLLSAITRKKHTHAQTLISQENEKNTAKIKELEGLIHKLSTKPVSPPTASTPVDLGDPAVIAAFNTYNNAQTNYPKTVRFPENNRSRSVSPFTYNRPNRPEEGARAQTPIKNNNSSQDTRITCYNCGKKGHISRECWSRRGQQQQQLGRRRDDQRFPRDVRQNSERSGQNWRPNGGPQNNYRARSNERYDRNNSTYGRPFNQERGQNNNRYSQDYRNAPPNVQRQ